MLASVWEEKTDFEDFLLCIIIIITVTGLIIFTVCWKKDFDYVCFYAFIIFSACNLIYTY